MRALLTLVLILASSTTQAQLSAPKVPTTLPAIDWKCFSSHTISFAPPGSKFEELGVDGDNLKKPKIELHTYNNSILKVIENPTIPQIRKEYAVEMYKMTEDFAQSAPDYAWREDSGFNVRIFAFNVNDRILSVTEVAAPSKLASNTVRVYVCR